MLTMHTNVDSIRLDLLETTMYTRYSLLEHILDNLRDALLIKLGVLVAILDHRLATSDQELVILIQSISSYNSSTLTSTFPSTMLFSPKSTSPSTSSFSFRSISPPTLSLRASSSQRPLSTASCSKLSSSAASSSKRSSSTVSCLKFPSLAESSSKLACSTVSCSKLSSSTASSSKLPSSLLVFASSPSTLSSSTLAFAKGYSSVTLVVPLARLAVQTLVFMPSDSPVLVPFQL